MVDSKKKHVILARWCVRLAAALLPCLLTIAFLEILLHCLPVQSYVPYLPVNPQSPVARYYSNYPFVYSQHWDLQNVTSGRTNAQGFVCDNDYDARDRRPLVAVIGDSYIEARMVAFPQTLQGQLRAGLSGEARVYAFAMNGAPLSQYLAFAKMARDTYSPDVLVVTIVSNDFDESFAEIHANPRFHYFADDADGNLIPRLTGDYRVSRLREMLSRSALVRYAYFHLRVTDAPRAIRRMLRTLPWIPRVTTRAGYAGTSADTVRHRRVLSERAAEAFLNLLPGYSGLPPGCIVLVLDGHRQSLYRTSDREDADFEHMRRYVFDRARRQGYEVIDLHPVFERDFQMHGQRFDFPHDAHWNARAHGLAAREVLLSSTVARLVSRRQ